MELSAKAIATEDLAEFQLVSAELKAALHEQIELLRTMVRHTRMSLSALRPAVADAKLSETSKDS